MDEMVSRLILLGIESIVLLPLAIVFTYLGVKTEDSDWFAGAFLIGVGYIIAVACTLFIKGNG